jgi:hypothetical protein
MNPGVRGSCLRTFLMGQFVRQMSIAVLEYAYSEVSNSKPKMFRQDLAIDLTFGISLVRAEIVSSNRGYKYWQRPMSKATARSTAKYHHVQRVQCVQVQSNGPSPAEPPGVRKAVAYRSRMYL